MSTEGHLKALVKVRLVELGAYFFMPVQQGYGKQTIDFLCCLKGRFLGIETKATGKEPTKRQDLCIQEIRAAGGFAFWCDSYESFLIQLADVHRHM